MNAQRYIVPSIAAQATEPGARFSFVPVNVEGPVTTPAGTEEPPEADLYDVVGLGVPPDVYFYHAEKQADGSIVVKRDLFKPGQFPHTFAGWPIPGDPIEQTDPIEKSVPGLELPDKWNQQSAKEKQ